MNIKLRNRDLVFAALMVCGTGWPQTPQAPLPDVRQLMKQVQEHQKQLDEVRETYTYSTTHITQDLDGNGRVVKTETAENEDFFVNGRVIEQRIKKNGQPLSGHDLERRASA